MDVDVGGAAGRVLSSKSAASVGLFVGLLDVLFCSGLWTLVWSAAFWGMVSVFGVPVVEATAGVDESVREVSIAIIRMSEYLEYQRLRASRSMFGV